MFPHEPSNPACLLAVDRTGRALAVAPLLSDWLAGDHRSVGVAAIRPPGGPPGGPQEPWGDWAYLKSKGPVGESHGVCVSLEFTESRWPDGERCWPGAPPPCGIEPGPTQACNKRACSTATRRPSLSLPGLSD
jgi:hypothetical protein